MVSKYDLGLTTLRTTTVYDATEDATVTPTGRYKIIVMETCAHLCHRALRNLFGHHRISLRFCLFMLWLPYDYHHGSVETVTVSTTGSAVGSTPTCGAVREPCGNDRGQCLSEIGNGQDTNGLFCRLSDCPSDGNQCESSSQCPDGQICSSEGATCSFFSCADQVV
jgi:hypothetical protein